MRRTAELLQIPLEAVHETQHIGYFAHGSLWSSAHGCEQGSTWTWQIYLADFTTIFLTCKGAETKYYVAGNGSEFLFTHSSPNSLVVDAINECDRHLSKAIPYDKDQKHLDFFSRKSYSSTTLQFQAAIVEGHLLARTLLQASFEAADTTAHYILSDHAPCF